MNELPKEIWVVPSYTGTDTGTYDALGEGDYNATKYIRADLTSQKQPELRNKEVCFSENGNNALEALERIDWFCKAGYEAKRHKSLCYLIQIIRAELESKQEPVDVLSCDRVTAIENFEEGLKEYYYDQRNGGKITVEDCFYPETIAEIRKTLKTQSAEKARDWLDKTACMKDAALVCKLTEQIAEKGAAIRDLVGIVKRQQRQLKNAGFTATLLQQDTTATLKTHAAAIEAAEKGGA